MNNQDRDQQTIEQQYTDRQYTDQQHADRQYINQQYTDRQTIDSAGDSEDEFDSLSAESASDTLNRYVAFVCDGLTYVISATYVTEIITNHTTTHLPMVPSFISGIINLRGQIIPIIDVRRRMGKPPLEERDAAYHCIIVLNIRGTEIGITVDTITKALDIDEARISPMPTSSQEILVNGIQTLADGQTVLFFDCNMLIDHF